MNSPPSTNIHESADHTPVKKPPTPGSAPTEFTYQSGAPLVSASYSSRTAMVPHTAPQSVPRPPKATHTTTMMLASALSSLPGVMMPFCGT